MDEYDVGLLNDWGGGNVAWWHDYLRYEIGRANSHWIQQTESLRAELAECKEQKDKWIIAAANAENSRDEAWRELDAAVRHCCGNYREGYDAARKGEGEV